MPDNHLSKQIAEIISKITRRNGTYDDSGLEDLSYEDALLDVEIRSFMRSEYGKQEPPSGILPRIVRSIRLYREEQAKAATAGSTPPLKRIFGRVGESFSAALKLIARPEAGRMLSGSLLTALLILVALPGIARSLSNGGGLGVAIESLLGEPGPITAQYDYQASTSPVESATGTSAASQSQHIAPAPPVAPDAAPAPNNPHAGIITPGRLYEDPRLMLAQRIGEDPNQLKPHTGKQPPQGNVSDGQDQRGSAPDYNRPIIGQY